MEGGETFRNQGRGGENMGIVWLLILKLVFIDWLLGYCGLYQNPKNLSDLAIFIGILALTGINIFWITQLIIPEYLRADGNFLPSLKSIKMIFTEKEARLEAWDITKMWLTLIVMVSVTLAITYIIALMMTNYDRYGVIWR